MKFGYRMGASVWMNADSEIRFPVVFTGQTRQVSLKGEAYFKVEKIACILYRECIR